MTAGFLADIEGRELVARIHDRKRLTQELAAADAVYTQAVQAAVAKQTDWAVARQAAEVVRQCRAAVKACRGDDE